jgi:hypothetical protein
MDQRGNPSPIQEDTIILTLIGQFGTSQWTTIASQMRTLCASCRSSKQIRERYCPFNADGTTNYHPTSHARHGPPKNKHYSSYRMNNLEINGKISPHYLQDAQTMQLRTIFILLFVGR